MLELVAQKRRLMGGEREVERAIVVVVVEVAVVVVEVVG